MVVTSGTLVPGLGHREVAEAAVRGGATALQLRAPELKDAALLPLAGELAALCAAAGVLFVVNDRLDVALASGADGVHLGQADDPAAARDRLGPGPILGISAATPTQARSAAQMGADYLGVTVWPTPTKPNAHGEGIAGLSAVCSAVAIPVLGIGGIAERNLDLVLDAGAAGIAVISAVAAAADPVAATRGLRRRIDGRKDGYGTTNG
ncbi:MAG: thiamine phosphate synthase [Actinomycetota bacterium]